MNRRPKPNHRTLCRALLAMGWVVTLAACQATAPPTGGSEPAAKGALLVATNLVGEQCRVHAVADPEAQDRVQEAYNVFCGRWEHPTARIYRLADPPSATASVVPLTEETEWWRQALARRVLCEKEKPTTILKDVDALLFRCRLRNGGWPYSALAARVDGDAFLADGIPAAIGVIEEAIGVISGRLEAQTRAAQGTVTATVRQMEAQLGGRLYGAGDLETYYKLMTAGQYYNMVKDFPAAEDRYREALAIHERLLGEGHPETMDPLMHLALELSNQQRYVEAQALFEEVGPLVAQAVDPADHARYLSYLALHAANQGKFEEALGRARQATKERRTSLAQAPRAGFGAPSRSGDVLLETGVPNPADIVQSLYIEAAMARQLGDVASADRTLESAQASLQAAHEAPQLWKPQLLGLGAKIAKSREDSAASQQQLELASNLWQQRAPGERPGALSYLQLGRTLSEQGRIDEAMSAFRTGVRLVRTRSGDLRFDQLWPFFETALALAEARPNRGEALHAEMFEAAQLVKSSRTAQDIARSVARLAATEGHAGKVIRSLQDAEDDLHALRRTRAAAGLWAQGGIGEGRFRELKAQDLELNRRIRSLNGEVQAAFPGYNQLIDAVVDTSQVLALLRPDEALVQVLLGQRQGLLFFARGGRVSAHLLELSESEAAGAVGKLREAFGEVESKQRVAKFDVSAAHELYQQTLGPVSEDLKGVEHLIAVPSTALLSLPLGLLVTEPPPPIESHDYTGVEWLAKRFAISLVPSVRAFVDLRAIARPSTAPKAFLGLGDFVPFSAMQDGQLRQSIPEACVADPERAQRYENSLRSSIRSLPLTRRELTVISKGFADGSTDLLFGRDFTETAVRSYPLTDYRVVYFATHALLPAQLECQPEPSLVTSLPVPPNEGDDGLLDASEVLELELDADVVVLSACNTGGPGKETGGESLSGLARAFFFAGARSLVVSHWSVQDEVTADTMIQFFANLESSPSATWADALRKAQLSVMNDKDERGSRSHPFFWGAFTLVGDGGRGALGTTATMVDHPGKVP